MQFDRVPSLLFFVGNPMRYIVSSGTEPHVPQLSQIKFEFTNVQTNGGTDDHMDITFASYSFTLTISDNPTERDQLPVADVSDTPGTWMMKVFEFIKGNLLLWNHYTMEMVLEGVDVPYILLTAREEGDQWDMVFPINTIRAIEPHTIENGMAPVSMAVDGYLLYVLDADSNLIGSDYKIAYETKATVFDVSEYLAAKLNSLVDTPCTLVTGYSVAPRNASNFTMYYTVGIAPVTNGIAGRMEWDSQKIAQRGGLNREMWNYWVDKDYFATRFQKFDTHFPVVKTTSKNAFEFLYFFAYADTLMHLRLRAYVINTDDTHDLVTIVEFHKGNRQMIEIPVGYKNLALQEYYTAKPVKYWAVWLELFENNVWTVLTNIKEYEIDSRYRQYERYFVFRNSFGVYETLIMNGKGEKILGYDKENITLNTFEDESMFNTPNLENNIQETQRFKCNSGFVSKEVIDWMREFLLSPERYEIIDTNRYRIRITSNKIQPFMKDGINYYSMEIEYERAYQDKFYSNQLT